MRDFFSCFSCRSAGVHHIVFSVDRIFGLCPLFSKWYVFECWTHFCIQRFGSPITCTHYSKVFKLFRCWKGIYFDGLINYRFMGFLPTWTITKYITGFCQTNLLERHNVALTLVCAPSIIQVSLYDHSFVGRVVELSYACNICMQRKNMIWQTHAFFLLFMFHK